jgi:hypothetical protein
MVASKFVNQAKLKQALLDKLNYYYLERIVTYELVFFDLQK